MEEIDLKSDTVPNEGTVSPISFRPIAFIDQISKQYSRFLGVIPRFQVRGSMQNAYFLSDEITRVLLAIVENFPSSNLLTAKYHLFCIFSLSTH